MSHYQPLPISTGQVGVDRCGNIVYYAAPRVVHARACWPCDRWPVPPQWCWYFPPHYGGGGGWPSVNPQGLSGILTGGAALANWMIAARKAA